MAIYMQGVGAQSGDVSPEKIDGLLERVASLETLASSLYQRVQQQRLQLQAQEFTQKEQQGLLRDLKAAGANPQSAPPETADFSLVQLLNQRLTIMEQQQEKPLALDMPRMHHDIKVLKERVGAMEQGPTQLVAQNLQNDVEFLKERLVTMEETHGHHEEFLRPHLLRSESVMIKDMPEGAGIVESINPFNTGKRKPELDEKFVMQLQDILQQFHEVPWTGSWFRAVHDSMEGMHKRIQAMKHENVSLWQEIKSQAQALADYKERKTPKKSASWFSFSSSAKAESLEAIIESVPNSAVLSQDSIAEKSKNRLSNRGRT